MNSLLKSIARFSHPHYVVNLVLSVVFFALKTISPICDHLFDDCQLELVLIIEVSTGILRTVFHK